MLDKVIPFEFDIDQDLVAAVVESTLAYRRFRHRRLFDYVF